MGFGLMKNRKGQISIEFILIILIVLVYITSVIQPTVKIATETTWDITRLSETKFAAQKLAAAINQLEASGGDGKKTISLFVPKGAVVECTGIASIDFTASLGSLSVPPVCDPIGRECAGSIELVSGISGLNCFGGSPIDASASNIFRKVEVIKDITGIRVAYAS